MKIPSSVSSLERISNFILKTPLIKSERLSSPSQNVYLKLEIIPFAVRLSRKDPKACKKFGTSESQTGNLHSL